MFQENEDRGLPTSLRGWLSDVYFPALLDKEHLKETHRALAARLGSRAAIDDPMYGRAAGLPALEDHIARFSQWLLDHQGSYGRSHFTTGIDRDVTEGTITLSL